MLPLDYFIFLQIILFLFITPGLPRVVIVSHTLNYGLKRSVWTAFGDISANICQGILVVFVIGSLLKDNPQALNLMKWAGILYIVFLAYDTYTAKLTSIKSKSKNLKSKLSFYRDGFLVAGLSPKAIIFFGTIFSSFIDFSGNYFGTPFYINRKFSCEHTSFATTASWCFCDDRIDKAFHVRGGVY